VCGEQIVNRLKELKFSHKSLNGDEARRMRTVGEALTKAANRQTKVLEVDTVVRVSQAGRPKHLPRKGHRGVAYSLRSKRQDN
jgi:hypothetical protein